MTESMSKATAIGADLKDFNFKNSVVQRTVLILFCFTFSTFCSVVLSCFFLIFPLFLPVSFCFFFPVPSCFFLFLIVSYCFLLFLTVS